MLTALAMPQHLIDKPSRKRALDLTAADRRQRPCQRPSRTILLQDDPEFRRVANGFYASVSMKQKCIVRIEKIRPQSKIAKMHALHRTETTSPEVSVWHGTAYQHCDSIIAGGFRGELSKRAAFGDGSYHARDAKYSLNEAYAKKDASGHQHLLYSRLVVGEKCKGKQGMAVPSISEVTNMPCDTMVDNMINPKIYVAPASSFASCLPLYLLTCKAGVRNDLQMWKLPALAKAPAGIQWQFESTTAKCQCRKTNSNQQKWSAVSESDSEMLHAGRRTLIQPASMARSFSYF